MKKLFSLSFILFLAGIFCLSQQEHVNAYWQSRDSNYNIAISGGGGGGYTGPGDAISGAKAFYSCARAYNAAYATATGNMCIIADVGTGAITCTMKAATSGFADLTSSLCAGATLTVPAFCTAHTSCVVTQMYDQSGATACNPTTACNITNGTLAQMPGLAFNTLNSLPCLTFNGSQNLSDGNTITLAQPYSVPGVVERTTTAPGQYLLGDSSGVTQSTRYTGTANAVQLYSGTASANVTQADNTWHGIQSVTNGASSAISVDGSSTGSLNAGTNGFSNVIVVGAGAFAGGMCEVGLWPTAWSSGQQSTMFTNQNGSSGYNGAL